MTEQHNTDTQQDSATDIRTTLRDAIAHLEHVLPGQAPIRDFVHHNTLHGFQHLPFPEALKAAHDVTGIYGYLSPKQFRKLYQKGRINRDDLVAALKNSEHLTSGEVVIEADGIRISQCDLIIETMIHSIQAVTGSQLNWQIEEQSALENLHHEVSPDSRQRIIASSNGNEKNAVHDLWQACLERLGLQYFLLHPEELTDLSPEQAERMLASMTEDEPVMDDDQPMLHILMRRNSGRQLDELLAGVGQKTTLGGMLKQVTGHDILDEIRPILIQQVANYLDQGMAAWHSCDRTQGFFDLWRQQATDDLTWMIEDLPEWCDELELLPEDALETVVMQLQRLGLPESRWTHYLERLALELPGWSGMFLWRHLHPGYEGLTPVRVEMLDYLAVRLVLERIFARRLCRQKWQITGSLDMLRWYFRRRRSEFYIRYTLFNERLPEYLVNLAQQLTHSNDVSHESYNRWQRLADMIWTWKHSPASDRRRGHTVYRSGWRLFMLAQHLGLTANEIRNLDDGQLKACFHALDLNDEATGFLWLQAYEHHYHEQIFNALTVNHGRAPWNRRDGRPEAQVTFCMDDREEGIRRHLEELNPRIETLGAAGFFGVAINWKGLDDQSLTPLCPIVVTPAHDVHEKVQPGMEETEQRHRQRRSLRLTLKDLLFQDTRRNLLSTTFTIMAAAPVAALTLGAKLLAPLQTGKISERLRIHFDKEVPTRVAINAESEIEATPQQPRLGFSDIEQADRVQNFLCTIGLQQGFAPLVVMMGHGSGSQNNPHLAAYDCGACSGRHGGPNARIFAAMANRPEIRTILAQRGIQIPPDTWFIGAEHNTCDERMLWYDTDQIPQPLQDNFEKLRSELDQASRSSAHERARRFASAPDTDKITPEQAYHHIVERAYDFSQARPELGHATNAVAFIGRRAFSRGAFFDRRCFLISYDPTQDADGKVVESILLNAGPVGAGINLEYYFSTVSNDGYGCGSKVTHNVTGMLGVMHGASDDLRTGLPRQMTEIHEAMRLLVVVEAKTEILTEIYTRQPPLQELVGNGWLLLAAKDPESAAIHVFKPEQGWVRWQGEISTLPMVKRSPDWYSGQREPLPITLIEQPSVEEESLA